MNWYAFYVKTGYEHSVKNWLNKSFDKETLYSMVPQRIVPEKKNGEIMRVEKDLFPGYIFVKTDMNFSKYYFIRSHSKIIRMLNYLNKIDLMYDRSTSPRKSRDPVENREEALCFKKIPEEEITIILRLLNHDEQIDFSQVYTQDSKVYVESGPLKGMEGIVKKVDKHKRRVKVLVSLMGDERMIDLGIELIEPMVSSGHAHTRT
ncbi:MULTISPECIES: antiterminator LoaP [Brevibacillus]|jgi:transcriptional antiterminator NusG|uniref:antiterminator LoaP n=1 Tax=Brevibacillus TaxID=55080 RepID=UPI000EDBF89D|nr:MULTISPECIES: antiterminator LoaP [Brevibacillus]MBU8710982.1 antiterminator LoaP [Brevibacillus parabrevis]MDH6351841.1 transcriptional antiterminator NusG [Brevibacillus sp. 1238]MDR5002073.1 antiterminator LoaP [Brevibacillus parabrevis]NRQ55300.1 antiterminator LoaP [Brevibacillus sp. HD1.4A]UED66644.1 antiterminator LoaP [Brevibacillus sp. HD3.3A]